LAVGLETYLPIITDHAIVEGERRNILIKYSMDEKHIMLLTLAIDKNNVLTAHRQVQQTHICPQRSRHWYAKRCYLNRCACCVIPLVKNVLTHRREAITLLYRRSWQSLQLELPLVRRIPFYRTNSVS